MLTLRKRRRGVLSYLAQQVVLLFGKLEEAPGPQASYCELAVLPRLESC